MGVGTLGQKLLGTWRTSGQAFDRFANEGLSLGRVRVGDLFVIWANTTITITGGLAGWMDLIGVVAENGVAVLVGFTEAGDAGIAPAVGTFEPAALVYKIPNPVVLTP